MSKQKASLNQMGALYIVATPIGNLGDMSARAISVLQQVDLIAAEDTRHSKPLLQHYAINTPCRSLHDYNEKQRSGEFIELLQQGKSMALISDAGTPLISDPGFALVRAVRAAGFAVIPIPGACAAIAALSAAGLPSDRFVFEGFLPAKTAARQQRLESIRAEGGTVIFYEAPHRILDLIEDMILILGPEREAVIAKELTKTFETIIQGNLSDLKNWLLDDSNPQRGEFVVLLHGISEKNSSPIEIDPTAVLKILLEELSVKQAAALTAKITGEKKNTVYELALQLKNQSIG